MAKIKLGNLDISAFKVGSDDCKIYLGDTLLYPTTPPTPTGTCYEVISTPITSYTATTYDSVYSYADLKWYMRNNLNQYEEYGIYDTGSTLSGFTYYNNKLVAIGEIEYQRKGNEWVEVGTYANSSVSYEISSEAQLQGTELSTTFKIPYADFESAGWVDFDIYGTNNEELHIMLDIGGMVDYSLNGDSSVHGTVTNDGEYFYLSLPDGSPQSIVIDHINYMRSNSIHIIVGLTEATVEYEAKEVPIAKVFNTVADMEAVGCPTVGVNDYAFVGKDLYKYSANEEWDGVTYYDPKMVALYENGNQLLLYNGSGELTQDETKIKNVSPISVYIGDNVTSIGKNAFRNTLYPYANTISSVTFSENSQLTSIGSNAFLSCSGLTSITIPSGVTSIGDSAFQYCSGLTSITIPNSVTEIGAWAFNNTPWWNSYSADTSNQYGNIIYINDVAYKAVNTNITSCTFREGTVNISANAFAGCSRLTSVTIPSGVTSIGEWAFSNCSGLTSINIGTGIASIDNFAFYNCRSLTSVTINAVNPPALVGNVFQNTNANLKIYVPAASLETYKENWTDYASRLQAIP